MNLAALLRKDSGRTHFFVARFFYEKDDEESLLAQPPKPSKAQGLTVSHPIDPIAGERTREVLALGAPEEPVKPELPKPTRMELLATWKINAAESQTPAHR